MKKSSIVIQITEEDQGILKKRKIVLEEEFVQKRMRKLQSADHPEDLQKIDLSVHPEDHQDQKSQKKLHAVVPRISSVMMMILSSSSLILMMTSNLIIR